MTLYWFDEGDGYQHAHQTPACQIDREVVDFMLEENTTTISIILPTMTAEQAKKLAEELYILAILRA